ncbi:MAG: filamentous hemagglutinin N-terminal domain-containing protein [Gammaproteobacteria bacterium]|nr:filamentous hemagglutinin N-terminal domain-containing protein [Gammaproteobacteria bacterium]
MRYRALTIGLTLGMLSGSAAEANPQAAVVINGQAGFARPGANALDITTTPGAILHWQNFSIGQQEITRFVQSSAASSVLNRVVGRNPSEILGQFVSNGRVFLINPNGIVIGPGARIDTAALVASTLNITDQDFLAGKLNFTAGDTAGAIKNYGYVKAGPKGEIVLIAPQIENHGTLEVEEGQLILAAGEKVKLASLDVDDVTFEVQAPGDRVLNLGRLIAEQGAIGVFAGTIRNAGLINADSLSRDAQGRIVLSATNDVTLDAGSAISANGPNGGAVKIASTNGTTLVSGTVSATGTAEEAAAGQGGRIEVVGERVGLLGTASLDVSGTHGGGAALVGGDFHGGNSAVKNAQDTYVATDAKIAADALTEGNGGKVVVWADDTTRFHGAVSARGGAAGGDGGQSEISGKNSLAFDGTVDATAAHGRTGSVLFDPLDVTITPANTTDDGQISDATILFGDHKGGGATVDSFTMSESALEVLGADILIQTNRDFTINSGLVGGLTLVAVNKTFTVRAGRHIVLNSALNTNGGAITFTAGDTGATGFNTSGAIAVNAGLSTGGGAFDVTSGSTGSSTLGGTIDLGGGALNASGPLTITGTLKNATLNATSLTSSGAVLDTVTLGTSMTNTGTLYINSLLTLADTVNLNMGGSQLRYNTAGGSIVTATPGVTHSSIQLIGGSLYNAAGGTDVIGQGVTVEGYGTVSTCCVGGGALVNAGTLDANVAGQTLNVSPNLFSSTGALTASAGTLTIAPTNPWTNTGALNVTAAGAILGR